MEKQLTNTVVKNDLAVIVSVYFFTIVGLISLFTILFAGFFTFVLPNVLGNQKIVTKSQVPINTTSVSNITDRYFETIK